MIKSKPSDRRLYPRIYQKLPLNIAANGYDFSTTTKNVSCVGAYCHIEKYVPPFTRVALKMKLPVVTERARKSEAVACKGVIVRTEDEADGGFNIAIFFNEINASQKLRISRYLSQFLPK